MLTISELYRAIKTQNKTKKTKIIFCKKSEHKSKSRTHLPIPFVLILSYHLFLHGDVDLLASRRAFINCSSKL